jgi:site-specific DNA recombinase
MTTARRRGQSGRQAAANAGRVVLYVRVSSVRGRSGDEFHSPQLQLDGMRALVTRDGLREVEVIDDDIDVSGRTFDRKGILRIREMVELGLVDFVAVYTLTRLGRNLSESLTFIKWLREHHVGIISANERIDDSPEGQFLLGLWLNFAELQSNQIGAAWSRVIERRAKQGKKHGTTNIGYLKDGTGRLVVDPEYGPMIAAMFRDYAAGRPVGEIRDELSRIRGRPFSRAQLKHMLRNPAYRGRAVVDSATGGLIDVAADHQALVDETTWRRVARRLASESTMAPRYVEPLYGLTGLLRCALCGGAVVVARRAKRPSGWTLRVTCARHDNTKECAGIGSPQYVQIEEGVLRAVAEYAGQLRGDVHAEMAQQTRKKTAGLDAKRLAASLTDTRQAMARLTERMAAEEAALVAKLADAEDRAEEPPPSEVLELANQLLELWPEMTGAEQNRALRTVLSSVTIRRAAYYREPGYARITAVGFRWV